MFNISVYLEKFKNLGQREGLIKNEILFVIKEVVGVDIDPKKIKTKNGGLFLGVSPAIKNTIYIKKDLILNKLKERGIKNINLIQ